METKPLFRIGMREAAPVQVGEAMLHLASFAVEFRIANVSFVWNTPLRVRVERQGQSRELLILDWTRIFLFGLGAATAMAGVAPLRRTLKGGTGR